MKTKVAQNENLSSYQSQQNPPKKQKKNVCIFSWSYLIAYIILFLNTYFF